MVDRPALPFASACNHIKLGAALINVAIVKINMHTIALIQARLNTLLPVGPWIVAQGQKTIRAEYVPASEAMFATANIDLVAQFWMMSPFKWLTFEFAGDPDQKMMRDHLAGDFRRYLIGKEMPNWTVLSKGSTICRVPVHLVGRNEMQMLSAVDKFVSLVRDGITDWTSTLGPMT